MQPVGKIEEELRPMEETAVAPSVHQQIFLWQTDWIFPKNGVIMDLKMFVLFVGIFMVFFAQEMLFHYIFVLC